MTAFPQSAESCAASVHITQLLDSIKTGQATADRLFPLIYEELRRLAAQRLRNEPAGHTLQPTALVHEAYLRLVGPSNHLCWDSRGHFFAAAAEAMRRILVENARGKLRKKRGGTLQRTTFAEHQVAAASLQNANEQLVAISEVLDVFAAYAPEKAQLVKLRYFAGLSETEAAEALGVSRATAARWWAYSKAWLFDRLRSQD